MRYFEASEPYYALIHEESIEKAKEVYIELVAGKKGKEHEIKMREADPSYAFQKIRETHGRAGHTISIAAAGRITRNPENKLLLIDGSLL